MSKRLKPMPDGLMRLNPEICLLEITKDGKWIPAGNEMK